MSADALGAAASLGSAASWALAALLWRRLGSALSPEGMNLAKCVFGVLYMGALLCVEGSPRLTAPGAGWLAASGLLGIALGDTLYFHALMRLGPGRATLMAALGPVLTALAAAAVLGERPTPAAWAGILLTSGGVAWVLAERAPDGPSGDAVSGACLGLAACACTAFSFVLAKKGLSSLSPASAAFQRLLWGGAGLAVWGAASGSLREWSRPLARPAVLRDAAAATAVAAFGGFWLSMTALRRMDASLAGALSSTTPLFVLAIGAGVYGERVSARAALGAAAAVAGVVLLVSRL